MAGVRRPGGRAARRVAYAALEALTLRGGVPVTVGGSRLRLVPAWWRAFPASYEQEVFARVRRALEPGMVAFDVGAHVGIHSVPMALRVGGAGRVVAFEPNPAARAVLTRHARLNGCAGTIRVEPLALGSAQGRGSLYTSAGAADPGSSLYPQPHLGERVAVRVTTLDAYCGAAGLVPDLVKIDVEGYERRVLEGGGAVLSRHRPPVVVEVHADHLRHVGDSPDALLRTVRELGYAPHAPDGRPLTSLDRGGAVVLLPAR